LGACELEPDVSGAWLFSLAPSDVDAGVPTISREDVIHAQLQQVQPPGVLSLGRFVYGTLASDDPGFFDTLYIPRLANNGGSKTGSMLGCQIRINVPLEMPVTDDDVPPVALKLSLVGKVIAAGLIAGDPESSTVIPDDDPTMTSQLFAWTGTRP
jgi:hypothetical protein